MPKQTPLYESHLALGGLMVDFAGWKMPLHYGSQITEHQQVREDAGIFDVSHMGILDIEGEDASVFLRIVLANNIDKIRESREEENSLKDNSNAVDILKKGGESTGFGQKYGQALYSCMLNEKGGVIDDLIVYDLTPNHFRLIVNAARTEFDLAWLNQHKGALSVNIIHRTDLGILAIQGPNARSKTSLAFPSLRENIQALKSFQFFLAESTMAKSVQSKKHSDSETDLLIAQTGYTGEDGLEVLLPKADLKAFWDACLGAQIFPIGLGARDTLRLEAGLNLYGQDMNESVTPLESNLAWTVAFLPSNRNFIGREALNLQQSQGIPKKLVGILLLEKGVLRHGQKIFQGENCVGEVTSGSFSPTLKKSIALARIQSNIQEGSQDCRVEIRNQLFKIQILKPPFVRRRHAKNTERT